MHVTPRQKEILEYLGRHIEKKGYAPTIEEIGEHFGLSSLATVHKHLTNLQEKGLIKREWNRSRALELVPSQVKIKAVELPLMGRVAAGTPIEAVQSTETIFVPEDMLGHLFDPFVTTKPSGSGLGLALVAKIIGDHGGIIECESQPRRTVFRVLMPKFTGDDAEPGGGT